MKYSLTSYLKSPLNVAFRMVVYNLRVIFGNRFVYFFAASLLFYFLVTGISLFSTKLITPAEVYSQLLFPGLLFVFFPTVFGIQNDSDARVLEIIFGIPNYRYKVYLLRLLLILLMQFTYLLFLSSLSGLLLVNIPVVIMAARLMLPMLFFGMIGFSFSTVVRNGNGTIVVLVIVGLAGWVLTGILGESKWNMFLNPFAQSDTKSEMVWASMISQNHTILLVTSLVLLLWGVLNLQKREKFMK
jgi:hypothetical protein